MQKQKHMETFQLKIVRGINPHFLAHQTLDLCLGKQKFFHILIQTAHLMVPKISLFFYDSSTLC